MSPCFPDLRSRSQLDSCSTETQRRHPLSLSEHLNLVRIRSFPVHLHPSPVFCIFGSGIPRLLFCLRRLSLRPTLYFPSPKVGTRPILALTGHQFLKVMAGLDSAVSGLSLHIISFGGGEASAIQTGAWPSVWSGQQFFGPTALLIWDNDKLCTDHRSRQW